MKLNVKAMAISIALVWGGAVFLVGLTNLIWPSYGGAFLELVASVYPGYKATASIADVIVGTLYALLDGLVAGLIFAWVYNVFTSICTCATNETRGVTSQV
ncbi:MAG: hypothetical protein JSV03_17675 [Planctomycetota bacterium]|nr:MAG: hypothetical protein JSV03_17675 [Planctomycetota bacterium]